MNYDQVSRSICPITFFFLKAHGNLPQKCREIESHGKQCSPNILRNDHVLCMNELSCQGTVHSWQKTRSNNSPLPRVRYTRKFPGENSYTWWSHVRTRCSLAITTLLTFHFLDSTLYRIRTACMHFTTTHQNIIASNHTCMYCFTHLKQTLI